MSRWSFLALSLLSCSVRPLDVTGKACPCPDGWTCVSGLCARADSQGCGDDGRYRVESFAGGWATEGFLQWRWETTAETVGADLVGNVLVVGTDDDVVTDCGCRVGRGEPCQDPDVRVVTADENPELGYDTLSTTTRDVHLVRETITGDHQPGTSYAAVLISFDVAGGVARTGLARNRTLRPTLRAEEIFDSGPTAEGRHDPVCMELTGGEGYSHEVLCPPLEEHWATCRDGQGSCRGEEPSCLPEDCWPGRSLEWRCEPEEHPAHETVCWIAPYWSELSIPLGESIDAGAFGGAHVELHLTIDSTTATNYSEVLLRIMPETGTDEEDTIPWRYRFMPLRVGGQQREYQIPLTAFRNDATGESMTMSDLSPSGSPFDHLWSVQIGSSYAHRDVLTFRSLVIRY